MLLGIHPLLTGEMLRRLDVMGHSDRLVIADANFPAHRFDPDAIDCPGLLVSEVVRAVRSVLPLDIAMPTLLMNSPEGELPIHREIAEAIDGPVEFLERFAFYDAAQSAVCVIRTGETRPFGNALMFKGVVE